MKSLLNYKEFESGYPSMKDSFSSSAYAGKDKIIAYLNKGKKTIASPVAAYDVFTGERIDKERYGMTDGEYCWNNSLAHYVQNYNLRLDANFEEKVLSL